MESKSQYKSRFVDAIVNNVDIMKAIINRDTSQNIMLHEPDALEISNAKKENIFTYQLIPKMITESNVFITMKFVFRYHNRMLNEARVTFFIMNHQDLQETGLGQDRNDFINDKIVEIFDGKDYFGVGKFALVSNDDTPPVNQDYVGSRIEFETYRNTTR